MRFLILTFAVLSFLGDVALAQQNPDASKQSGDTKKKKRPPFQWVNPLKEWDIKKSPNVLHKTFVSSSMKAEVGYCIYLPAQYSLQENREKRFPVVYYLHGGRPGSEKKSIRLSQFIDKHIQAGSVAPMIYVFVNGGPVSHYNMPDKPEAQGASVFIEELIPHIDKTYRTIARREGRGLEGFSQGGRGTARLMFRHPDLFCSAAPGGGGHATEKRISESGGAESETLVFTEGDNTWDLARSYAKSLKQDGAPTVRIYVHVGDKGFNYQNNLEWMGHLDSLGISYEKLIVPGAEHSAQQIYEADGLRIMKFHAKNFGL
ncbi:MAG: alpha/beta hydrolase-fold protein [Planctomycetota bacterium]